MTLSQKGNGPDGGLPAEGGVKSAVTNIGVTFGALAEPFRLQPIGKYLSAKLCEIYQRQSDAISLLRIGGLITDAAAKSARDKIYKRMCKSVKAKAHKGASS